MRLLTRDRSRLTIFQCRLARAHYFATIARDGAKFSRGSLPNYTGTVIKINTATSVGSIDPMPHPTEAVGGAGRRALHVQSTIAGRVGLRMCRVCANIDIVHTSYGFPCSLLQKWFHPILIYCTSLSCGKQRRRRRLFEALAATSVIIQSDRPHKPAPLKPVAVSWVTPIERALPCESEKVVAV